MNRDSGTVEEKLEVFTSSGKHVVYDVTDTVIYSNKNSEKSGVNDWESTLFKRGFDNIIDSFLQAIRDNRHQGISIKDALKSHEICEKVVRELENI
jgi:virulence factor